MNVLVDACAGSRLAMALSQAGHDVVFAGDRDPPSEDHAILSAACREHRTIVTRDKDFGALVFRDQLPHRGIVRLVRLSPKQETSTCLFVLDKHASDLARGAIITVEPGRIRVRKPIL